MNCHALYGFCLLALGSLTNEGNLLPSLRPPLRPCCAGLHASAPASRPSPLG